MQQLKRPFRRIASCAEAKTVALALKEGIRLSATLPADYIGNGLKGSLLWSFARAFPRRVRGAGTTRQIVYSGAG